MNKTDKDQNHFVLIGLAVVLVFLIVCPIAAIFAKAVIMDGRLDLYHAWNILRNTENVTMIGNSFLLGVLVVVLSTVIAAPLAYLFSRTKFAKCKVYDIIFMIPFMTSPYIASMGWILFMQKKGLLQQLLPAAEGCEKIFFSLGGLVLVMSLHVFPFMLTMLKNAMRNIPSSLEETGAVFGAGFGARVRRIFLPLLSGNYAIGVPYFSVISTSLINLRGYGLAPGNFTWGHYIELFAENTKGISALKNSVFLAVTSAAICAVLGTLLALSVHRSKSRLRRVVEMIGLLPEMLPGIVLVIGIMLFWNQIYQVIPLYNTLGIMVLAYVVLFLPYTVQYVTSSLTQVSDSLTAAGRVFGGSPLYILLHITLPLIKPGIVTGFMMTFIIAFRELVTASLIAPPNTLVVSTYIMREFEQGSVSVGMAMAVLDCAYGTWTPEKGDDREEAALTVRELLDKTPLVFLPVPQYGRGLDLLCLLHRLLPGQTYYGDKHFCRQVEIAAHEEKWYRCASIKPLRQVQPDADEKEGIIFLSDPQLRGETGRRAMELLELGAAGMMTGTVDKGSLSERLIDSGAMRMCRYPVHLNDAMCRKLIRQNRFQKVIRYHSPEYAYGRRIEV